MTETSAIELAAQALKLAQAAGADSAEASVSVARRFHAEARESAISKLEGSTGKSLFMRIFREGRKATFLTSDFSVEGMNDGIRRAVAQAAHVEVDEFAGLPETVAPNSADLALFDDRIAGRDGGDKVDDAIKLERLIREADTRIVNSSGSSYSDAVAVTAIANTSGFSGAYAWTRAGRSTGPVALDGGVKRIAHYGTAGRYLGELEPPAAVATTAVRRAVDLFGARKPQTMRVPVIFERDVAAQFLDDIFAAVSAANVAINNSWLTERVGSRVGSEMVTIVDDGCLPGKLGSSPFDGEGVPTRRTPVFENGVLRTFLYDTYYARKLGNGSTGNSTGGGIGPNNFYLEPGPMSLSELIAATPIGVLVLDTIGFATEHASGTYSRGARGFFIENGELAYPIDEFTVAGQYTEMLERIDAVASDLRWDAAVLSPSFRMSELTVSGN
ncbi:MAG TPA: TldD/PmbA family protein [Candidatus Cybelea sp.]|jgi:PmbA protein|nr:TldD/PmbA family protein [Candidatus Cybelea sp.]